MPNTIHFPEKAHTKFMQGFTAESETEGLFSHDLDMEFSGVNTVHVYELKTEPLQNYNRSVQVGTGSRYGTTTEVGDYQQTFTMTQDKSLSLSVDKGNNKEQFNMKRAGEIMKAERQDVIVPEIDGYRMTAWAQKGGVHMELTAAPTKATIVDDILKLKRAMRGKKVPKNGLRLLISGEYLDTLILSDQWIALDSLGGKSLPSGALGKFAGMAVMEISEYNMPENVAFMILHKDSVIAPMKIKDWKAHVDPPGLSGDLIEFRMMHDAFVKGKKAAGVGVAILPNHVVKAPTVTVSSGTATLKSNTDGATIKYTTDGSDPRYSVDAVTGTSVAGVTSGTKIRCYAEKAGMYASDVTDYVHA